MFNLRAKRRKHPLGKLRALSDDCLDLRPSDIAGPWRDTTRNVEKLVILVPARGGTFDLDEFSIRTLF